jgi:hypothetical protein
MVANKGMLPIGLNTTKRATVDIKIPFPKILKNEDKSINIVKNESIVIVHMKPDLLLKFNHKAKYWLRWG